MKGHEGHLSESTSFPQEEHRNNRVRDAQNSLDTIELVLIIVFHVFLDKCLHYDGMRSVKTDFKISLSVIL